MGVIKPLRNLSDDTEGLFGSQSVARIKNVLEGHTGDQFHDNATGLVFRILKGVVNSDDGVVRQPAGCPHFTHEHLLRAVGSIFRSRG